MTVDYDTQDSEENSKKLYIPYICSIPYEVRIDNHIPDPAKIYFGELCGIAKKGGVIWATDEELAEMKGTDERTIKRWNKALEERGYILKETFQKPYYNEDGKMRHRKRRKIYLGEALQKIIAKGTKMSLSSERDKNVPIVRKGQKCPYIEREEKERNKKEEEEAAKPPPTTTFFNADEEKERRLGHPDFKRIGITNTDREILLDRGKHLSWEEWCDVCKAFTQRSKSKAIDPIVPYFTTLIQNNAKPNLSKKELEREEKQLREEEYKRKKAVMESIVKKVKSDANVFMRTRQYDVEFQFPNGDYTRKGYLDEHLHFCVTRYLNSTGQTEKVHKNILDSLDKKNASL